MFMTCFFNNLCIHSSFRIIPCLQEYTTSAREVDPARDKDNQPMTARFHLDILEELPPGTYLLTHC